MIDEAEMTAMKQLAAYLARNSMQRLPCSPTHDQLCDELCLHTAFLLSVLFQGVPEQYSTVFKDIDVIRKNNDWRETFSVVYKIEATGLFDEFMQGFNAV